MYQKGHDANPIRAATHRVNFSSRDATLESQAGPNLELDQVFPSLPHHLVDFRGGHRLVVESILNHREVERRADEVACPLAWLPTVLRQLGVSRIADG